MAKEASNMTTSKLPHGAHLITTEVLEQVLRASENKDTIVVDSIVLSGLLEKGDGVLGNLIAITATTRSEDIIQERHLVAKADFSPETDFGKFTKRGQFFVKEVGTYTKLFPAMLKYQLEMEIDPIALSVPTFVHGMTLEETSVFFMEDIRTDGYKRVDIRKGLDFEHCKLAMNEFAKFHALSYALKGGSRVQLEQNFDFVISENVWCPFFMKWFGDVLRTGADISLEVLKETVDDEEIIKQSDKLRGISVIEFYQRHMFVEEPFATICLRDTVARNMLFQYEQTTDGKLKPVRIKLLDFQTVTYSMPTIDLAFFLYTSTTGTLRQTHLPALLRLYHNSFESYLKHLKIEIPGYSYDVLLRLFDKSRIMGIFTGITTLPYALIKPEDFPDVSQLQSAPVITREISQAVLKTGNSADRLTDLIREAVNLNIL